MLPLLPQSVEQLLETIRDEKSTEPADEVARRELARIGEDQALEILQRISRSPAAIRTTLSRFIMYMVRNHANEPRTPERRRPEPAYSQESVNFSGPASPTFGANRGWFGLQFVVLLKIYSMFASAIQNAGECGCQNCFFPSHFYRVMCSSLKGLLTILALYEMQGFVYFYLCLIMRCVWNPLFLFFYSQESVKLSGQSSISYSSRFRKLLFQ